MVQQSTNCNSLLRKSGNDSTYIHVCPFCHVYDISDVSLDANLDKRLSGMEEKLKSMNRTITNGLTQISYLGNKFLFATNSLKFVGHCIRDILDDQSLDGLHWQPKKVGIEMCPGLGKLYHLLSVIGGKYIFLSVNYVYSKFKFYKKYFQLLQGLGAVQNR